MKTITTFLLCAATFAASAQTQLTSTNNTIGEKADFSAIHAKYPWIFNNYNNNATQKRFQHTGWYSYVDAASDNEGITWTNITNSSLFPDSTVYQLYGASGGGTELGFTSLHNIGEVFDPKYEFFEDANNYQLSRFNNYTVDSVAFSYRYSYNKPGSVDTLRIQFYHNAQIQHVQFSSPGTSVSLQYNSTVNASSGTNFYDEIEIYLDANDTTGDNIADAKLMTVAVSGTGLKPTPIGRFGKNNYGLAAFTMTYHPGYTYNFGDTLQHDWEETPVVNKLNHFRPTRVSDRNNNDLSSQNKGMFIFNRNLYDNANSGWPNLFIPCDALQDSKDHLYAQFHIITDASVSVNDINNGYSLGTAYPNPVNTNGSLNIDFTLGNTENVTIELYSITGAKVATLANGETFSEGTHTITTQLNNIPAGMYFYTIKAGNYTATNKVNVVS